MTQMGAPFLAEQSAGYKRCVQSNSFCALRFAARGPAAARKELFLTLRGHKWPLFHQVSLRGHELAALPPGRALSNQHSVKTPYARACGSEEGIVLDLYAALKGRSSTKESFHLMRP